MTRRLTGKRMALLATDGVAESGYVRPRAWGDEECHPDQGLVSGRRPGVRS